MGVFRKIFFALGLSAASANVPVSGQENVAYARENFDLRSIRMEIMEFKAEVQKEQADVEDINFRVKNILKEKNVGRRKIMQKKLDKDRQAVANQYNILVKKGNNLKQELSKLKSKIDGDEFKNLREIVNFSNSSLIRMTFENY